MNMLFVFNELLEPGFVKMKTLGTRGMRLALQTCETYFGCEHGQIFGLCMFFKSETQVFADPTRSDCGQIL